MFRWQTVSCAAFAGTLSTGILNAATPTMESHDERLRGDYPLDATARLYPQPFSRFLQPARAPSRAAGGVCRRVRCRSLSEVAGVHARADAFWHTDVDVYARCDGEL